MKKFLDQFVDWLDGLSLESGLLLIAAFVVGVITLIAVVTREAFDTDREDRTKTIQSLRGAIP